MSQTDDGQPIYVFLIGNSPPQYLELTIQAIKYVKRNVRDAHIGIISPPGGEDLTQTVKDRLKEINPNADTENIQWIEGKNYFDDWNNTQRILDIETFAEEYDPIIFLDSDSVLMGDVSYYVKEFMRSNKKYGFINGYLQYKSFDENWEGQKFIPSTTFQLYRSAALIELLPVWKNQWKQWIEPAPFVNVVNPARFYKYSKLSIGQYALSKALQEQNSLDADVYEISRPVLKLVRNLAIDVQKSKRKFLGAGSSYSNDGPGKITLKVKNGKVNDAEDTYVEVKVGESDRNTKTINGTNEPVWDQEFTFDDAPIYGAADKILVTLWNNPKPKPPKARSFGGGYPGVAQVTLNIISGKITNKHDVVGEDDPYVKVNIGGVEKQTNYLTNTNTPEWNTTLTFDDVPSDAAQNITVSVFDWDKFTKHDLVGSATLNLLPYNGNQQPVTLTLTGENGAEEGTLQIEALVTPAGGVSTRDFPADDAPIASKSVIGTGILSLLNNKTTEKGTAPTSVTVSIQNESGEETATVNVDGTFYVEILPEEDDEPKARSYSPQVGGPYSGVAEVTLDIISGTIANTHDVVGEDDPYVKVSIGGVDKQTKYVTNTNKPKWNETLTFSGVASNDAQAVTITVWDWDKFTKHDLVGTATLDLLPYNGNRQSVSVSLVGENGTQEATVELVALVTPQ